MFPSSRCRHTTSQLAGQRVGLFSYGSGSAATLYSLRVTQDHTPGETLTRLITDTRLFFYVFFVSFLSVPLPFFQPLLPVLPLFLLRIHRLSLHLLLHHLLPSIFSFFFSYFYYYFLFFCFSSCLLLIPFLHSLLYHLLPAPLLLVFQ